VAEGDFEIMLYHGMIFPIHLQSLCHHSYLTLYLLFISFSLSPKNYKYARL
jgi:hypothetical protein